MRWWKKFYVIWVVVVEGEIIGCVGYARVVITVGKRTYLWADVFVVFGYDDE
jgi:hypothetical protein